MRYIPHTDEDIARMLRVIGAPSVEALFAHIPDRLRAKRPLDIPELDEATLLSHLVEIGQRGKAAYGGDPGILSFLGAGLISHYIPSAVDALLMRSEWYTSYTPYQPEISQGTLQAVFEYQTLVSELLGDTSFVANASMYDGASATAEAVLMARRISGKTSALLLSAVHPHYVDTISCYLDGLDGGKKTVFPVAMDASGRVSMEALNQALSTYGQDLACVVLQSPNYLGVVEDIAAVKEALKSKAPSCLLITACPEPLAYGLLAAPGSLGADIVTGEGIGLAIPPTLGGPGVGLFCAREDLVRQMPGRLVGQTVDQSGRRGFVLTLATREQHIRREKATSNICTNQGLIALAFTIHLCLLGKRGLQALAQLNLDKAQYAKEKISSLPGFSLAVSAPTFNEFAVRVPSGNASALVAELEQEGIFAGVSLDSKGYGFSGINHPEGVLLIAVSERHGRSDIDRLTNALSRAACDKAKG